MPMPHAKKLGTTAFVLAIAASATMIVTGPDGRAFAIILVTGGMIVAAARRICESVRQVNRPADEAWEDGYEIGYNKGWLARDAERRQPLRLITKEPHALHRETSQRKI